MKFDFTDAQDAILVAVPEAAPSVAGSRDQRVLPERQAHGC